jgi:hypothetical protein
MKFLLLAFIAYLYFAGLAYAWLQTYHMTAKIGSQTLGVYLDAAHTTSLPLNYDWGTILSGAQTPIWIRNEGTLPVTVHLTISNEIKCSVSTDTNNFPLTTGAMQQVTLTVQTLGLSDETMDWDLTISVA